MSLGGATVVRIVWGCSLFTSFFLASFWVRLDEGGEGLAFWGNEDYLSSVLVFGAHLRRQVRSSRMCVPDATDGCWMEFRRSCAFHGGRSMELQGVP